MLAEALQVFQWKVQTMAAGLFYFLEECGDFLKGLMRWRLSHKPDDLNSFYPHNLQWKEGPDLCLSSNIHAVAQG